MKTVSGRRSTLALAMGPKSSTSRRYSPRKIVARVLRTPRLPQGWRREKNVARGDESHGSASRDPPDHVRVYRRHPAMPLDMMGLPAPCMFACVASGVGSGSAREARPDNLVDGNRNPGRRGRPGHNQPRNPLDQPRFTRVQIGLHLAKVGSHLAKVSLPLGPHHLDVGSQRCECRLVAQAARSLGPALLRALASVASMAVNRRSMSSADRSAGHRFPLEPVPVRLCTSSRTWAPLCCVGLPADPISTVPAARTGAAPLMLPPW